jgi:carbon-monoxide dehydrogenase medium subunit
MMPDTLPMIPIASRSRHWVQSPRFFRPETVDEALRLLRQHPRAGLIAGGLDVVNRMKEGWAPDGLIAIDQIAALTRIGISSAGDDDALVRPAELNDADRAHEAIAVTAARFLTVGAAVTHDQLVTSAEVIAHLPDLVAAWERIANIRVRMQGTVGGNVFARNPGYEGAVLLGALGARAVVHDGVAARHVALPQADHAALHRSSPDLCMRFLIPLAKPGCRRRLAYERSARPALTVALALDIAGDTVLAARGVVGGCHDVPFATDFLPASRTLAWVRANARALARSALRGMAPPTVAWNGSATYRPDMAVVLLGRLIEESTS